MSDIHALSGAYAVDALDDLERAQFERHLRDCESCSREVESLREASALLAETTAIAPSPALRDRVLAEIATVRPLPPVVAAEPDRPRRRRVVAFLAAAAAAVAIGSGAVVWQQLDGPDSRVEQVLAADDAETLTQTFPGGATATVVRSKELDEAVIITEDMPAAPDGHSYALWLQHDDQMVPAGIMPEGEDNTVLLSGDAATADGVGITVETAGEDHAEPEGDVVALFEFEA
jgi:anti-sigma-K factor RskA